MADSMEPCKMLWGSTFVAMAKKFGLGAEIQLPTGLSLYLSTQINRFSDGILAANNHAGETLRVSVSICDCLLISTLLC